MADKRRAVSKKARRGQPQSDTLGKEQESWAQYVRFNCPCKQSTFEGNEVDYFTGQKAVDSLVDSKKYGAGAKTPVFATRQQAVDFLISLLEQGFFFRAKVLVPRPKPRPGAASDVKSTESPRVRKLKAQEESGNDSNDSGNEQKKEEEKKKKKIKLVPHDIQTFSDDTDVYIWVYDPTPLYKKVIGVGILFAVVAGCLFPLWPDWTKLAVYYLCVAGVAFFAIILAIGLARTILFGIIYVVTMGRHRFWFLPNLLADVGFFESFQPVYTYEYIEDGVGGKKKEKSKKSGKKDKREVAETSQKTVDQSQPKKPAEVPEGDEDSEKQCDEETDQEEKYSNAGSDDYELQSAGTTGSTNDSEIVDIQEKEGDSPQPEEKKVVRKRRNVRKANDDGFVMVEGNQE